eukprot:3703232-Pyramimonas_sp.AAC.1
MGGQSLIVGRGRLAGGSGSPAADDELTLRDLLLGRVRMLQAGSWRAQVTRIPEGLRARVR